jgi:acetyltransferase-like isoleucine patch superfamily enzyme
MDTITIQSAGISNLQCGRDVVVIEPTNLYGCLLGDGVFVGPFVEIQNGVSIGSGTRIHSHSFICEMVDIGLNCTIGHGVMFINDKYSTGGPARGDKNLWKSTRVGNNVSIGSNATILPTQICDNVVIGAGAVVTKDIVVSGIYAGNPAILLRTLPDQTSNAND